MLAQIRPLPQITSAVELGDIFHLRFPPPGERGGRGVRGGKAPLCKMNDPEHRATIGIKKAGQSPPEKGLSTGGLFGFDEFCVNPEGHRITHDQPAIIHRLIPFNAKILTIDLHLGFNSKPFIPPWIGNRAI